YRQVGEAGLRKAHHIRTVMAEQPLSNSGRMFYLAGGFIEFGVPPFNVPVRLADQHAPVSSERRSLDQERRTGGCASPPKAGLTFPSFSIGWGSDLVFTMPFDCPRKIGKVTTF